MPDRPPPRRSAGIAACLTTLILTTPLHAQDMLVLLRGTDTVAVERLARSAARLDGEILSRMLSMRFTWSLTLSRGEAVKLDNAFRRPTDDPEGPALQTAVLAFSGDSVIAEITSPGRPPAIQRFGSRPGALPYINPSFAMLEPGLARLRASGADSIAVPYFMVHGGQTVEVPMVRRGGDTVSVTFGPGQVTLLTVTADGRVTGGTVPGQGLRLVRAPAAGMAFTVPRPDYSAPPGAPYSAEDITIPTPMGHTLAGTLTLPAGPGPFPAVVTITGSGLQDRDQEIPFVRGYRPFRQIADTLSRVGIAVLRMDDRGFGGSGGDPLTATSRDLADDIRAGLAWLRTRPDIDQERLGLIGHSEGGLIGPLIAAEDTTLRALVILAGPSRTGREIIHFQQRYLIDRSPGMSQASRDSAIAAAQAALEAMASQQPWFRYFLDYDPRPVASRVRAATLILHGGTDMQVPAAQAEELAGAIRSGGNRDVTVRVFRETNHLFQEDTSGNPAGYGALPGRIRPEVIEVLTQWVARTLKQ